MLLLLMLPLNYAASHVSALTNISRMPRLLLVVVNQEVSTSVDLVEGLATS